MDQLPAMKRTITHPVLRFPCVSSRKRRHSAPGPAPSTTNQQAREALASQISTTDKHDLSASTHHILPPRSRPSTTGPTPSTPQHSTSPAKWRELADRLRKVENLHRTATTQNRHTATRLRVQPILLPIRSSPPPRLPRRKPMKWLGTPPSLPQQTLQRPPRSRKPLFPPGQIDQDILVRLQAATIQVLINDSLSPSTGPSVPHLAMLLVSYTEHHNLLRGYSSISRAFACTFVAAASLSVPLSATSHLADIGLDIDGEPLAAALFALYRQRERVRRMVAFFGGSVERGHLLGTQGPFKVVWRDVEKMEGHRERVLASEAATRTESVFNERQIIKQWRVEEERKAEEGRVRGEMWEERTRKYRERKGRGSPLRQAVCVGEEA